MTTTETQWRRRAHHLARQLAERGVLDDPAWRAAFESVPRHVFVPRFYRQQPDATWAQTASADPGWLDAVYSDEPLITALAPTAAGGRVSVSSSSKPALMARMLHALDLGDGMKVLEIGTGTGYNAALLSHRLGDQHVFSVDIGTQLVTNARERLAELGYAPTLAAVHGGGGFPDHAPYDRIIATLSVPAVPWAWANQLVDGGLVLIDVKRGSHAGNLALLRKLDNRLEGHFLPKWAGFMTIRDSDTAPAAKGNTSVTPENGQRSTTGLDPQPWTTPIPWLLADRDLPRLTFGFLGLTPTGPTWAKYSGDDGSWCAVRMQPDQHGQREVRQHGTIAIWDVFTRAHDEWETLTRPGWESLGLTVTPDGRHRVWLDDPNGPHNWELA